MIKYNSIIAPIVHSIKSLESTQTTPADVYVFWLAIVASIKEYLSKGSVITDISTEDYQNCQYEISSIHWSLLDDIYFTAFFLHCCMSLFLLAEV